MTGGVSGVVSSAIDVPGWQRRDEDATTKICKDLTVTSDDNNMARTGQLCSDSLYDVHLLDAVGECAPKIGGNKNRKFHRTLE